MGDFISSTVADQLGLKRIELAVPLPLQLAVQGSRSKINFEFPRIYRDHKPGQ